MSRDRLRVGACLSLTGRFGEFGRQAAAGLRAWAELDGDVEVVVEDDGSDPARLERIFGAVASQADVLLGPYSTQLVRIAGRLAADSGRLLWNHGGSGDDVEAAQPGFLVSILTPTSRYSKPFLDRVASDLAGGTLWVRHRKGRFGRQVAAGTRDLARSLGIDAVVVGPDEEFDPSPPWHLFSAGTFEDDVDVVRSALDMRHPPQLVCSVAAGVRSFAEALGRDPAGTYGVGQWFPGAIKSPLLGPSEKTFVSAYGRVTGGVTPDYPAAQAAAAALIATHCTRRAGAAARDLVWPIANELETTTLFGDYGIDPTSGVQLRHEAVLVRWTTAGISLA